MKKYLSAAIVMVALTLMPAPMALADDNVPQSLLAARDRLLKERDQLLSDRSNFNTQLKFLTQSRSQIEKALYGNPVNKPALLDARAQLTLRIYRTQTWLDHTERDLLDNDKDLNVVENELKTYACANL